MKTISGKSSAYPYIRRMEEFQTRSKNFRGEWDSSHDSFPFTTYRIYSYATVIAQYSQDVWYINESKYSGETGAQQSQIVIALGRKFLDDNAIFVRPYFRGVDDLRYYVSDGCQRRISRIQCEGLKPGEGKYYHYYSWGEKEYGAKHDDRWDYV